MNSITNSTLVPQGGGFVYVDPDSGHRFIHCTVEQLAVMAKKHRTANNYPIGMHWSQDFIDNVCRNTPGPVCTSDMPLTAVQKAANLASAIYDAARSGFKTLSPEDVVSRQHTCETSGPAGGACEAFKGFNGMFGVFCGSCGCAKLKLHLQSSTCPKSRWTV